MQGAVTGFVDQVRGVGHHLARAVDAGFGSRLGLLRGLEHGLAQPVGAQLGFLGGFRGGLAAFLGGGLPRLQRPAALFQQSVARIGRQGLEPVQRDLGGAVEIVGLTLGHLDQGTELVCGGLDQIAQRLGSDGGGLDHFGAGRAHDRQLFGQLRPLALDLGREVFLIGAQRIGGGHERGALLPQPLLDRLDLFGDAGSGVFEAQGLAGQIVGGCPGGFLGFSGGGGHIGSSGSQGRFSLSKLGLGQVRGLDHHARLAVNHFQHMGGLSLQRAAQRGHGLALSRQAFDQSAGGPTGGLSGLIQQAALLRQRPA